jgi:hypothetical protein
VKARGERKNTLEPQVIEIMKTRRNKEKDNSWRHVAADLNKLKIPSLRGGLWHDTTAKRAYDLAMSAE